MSKELIRGADIWLVISAFLLSAAITGVMMIYAKRADLLDTPNQRSSHQIVTPRGGGAGIVVVLLATVIWLFAQGKLPTDIFLTLFVGGTLVAGIGFVDDHRHVPARWRFLVQTTAAAIAVVMLGGLPVVRLGSNLVDLGLFGDALAIVFVVWLVNLYNFMDGIDGIAAAEAVCIVGAVIAITFGTEYQATTVLLFIFAASALGFLVWNWPPAKIFMGDVGSGFIGFVLAMFAIISSGMGLLPIWTWFILAGVFVVDATVTLITRMIHGEEWYSAHNNHAYQKAARRLRSHKSVTLAVLIINILWLLPIAWFASARPEYGWWLTVVAWLPLILLALFLKAGRPETAF